MHKIKKILLKTRQMWRRWRLINGIRIEAWLHNAQVEVEIDSSVDIGRAVRVEILRGSSTTLTIGRWSKLGDGVRLRLWGGEIMLGESVDIRASAILNVGGGQLRLDGPNLISWGAVIHCANSVHLKRFAYVAEYATVVDSSHYYTAPDKWSYHNTRARPIVLEEDVWVCPKCTITSGVTIGDHTIVAANSCVTKDAPRATLMSGVPAVPVRQLDLPWESGVVSTDKGENNSG